MLRSLLVGALLATSVCAQTNFRLHAHVDRFPGGTRSANNYAGCWGLTVNGVELAVVTARRGTLFYDCTDPGNPNEVAYIAGPTGGGGYFWRETNSWRHWVYIGSEHGAVQVVDCSNPTAPRLAGTFGVTSHTLNVDQDRGLLFLYGGSSRGYAIYDLNQSATNPPQIYSDRSPYVHEGYSRDGYLYLAEMFDGTFSIYDINNPRSPRLLGRVNTPSGFPHNIAVSDDESFALVTEERQGDCMAVYDISNKAAPRLLTRWCSPNGSTVHNVFLDGSVAYLACYADGVWAIDFSNPSQPRNIGQYDASSYQDNDYVGTWGAYPFQPSGVVYLSDMQSGFWVVEPTCGVTRRYGDGTPGTGGVIPGIDYEGGFAKVANSTFAITAQEARPGSGGALLIGPWQTSQVVLGAEILVDPLVAAAISITVAGNGTVNAPVSIPNTPSLAGNTFYSQVVVLDPGASQGVAATRGMKFAICR